MKWFKKVKKPIVGLAPMHQVSRSDLRQEAREAGADVVFSEMIASEAIIRKIPQALSMMKFSELERPIIIQIFGNNPAVMAKAAQFVEKEFAPDGIDINFGCPVQKAAKQGFGSCQLLDPIAASKIIRAIKNKINIPLSCKIRIPQKDVKRTVEFVNKMQQAGVEMVSIHGRLPAQKYRGQADWTHAYEVKKQFPKLIILGSGDIKSIEDFEAKIGNLDGVLIGRWAKNHPKIFSEIKALKLSRRSVG